MPYPFAPNTTETELLCDMLTRAAERGRRQGFEKPQYRRLSAVLLAMRADCPAVPCPGFTGMAGAFDDAAEAMARADDHARFIAGER